jgi:hypothetical protein
VELKVAIIAGVVGLLTGVVGSLVAPWVQWGIEKRRFRLNRRLEYIKQWRRFVSDDFDQSSFKETRTFKTMQPYLSQDLIAKIEDQAIYASMTGGDPIRSQLLDEITSLEREWKLI